MIGDLTASVAQSFIASVNTPQYGDKQNAEDSVESVPSSPVDTYTPTKKTEDSDTSAKQVAEPQQEDDTRELSEEDQEQVAEMKKRDQEVRTHEQAHITAGGAHVRGGASYSYESGPDGKRYAVAGEVSIDTSTEDGDPQATIDKMQTVRSAALAPADPSAQDRRVAAEASQKEAAARMELQEQRLAEQDENAEKLEKQDDDLEQSDISASETSSLQAAAQAYAPFSEQLGVHINMSI